MRDTVKGEIDRAIWCLEAAKEKINKGHGDKIYREQAFKVAVAAVDDIMGPSEVSEAVEALLKRRLLQEVKCFECNGDMPQDRDKHYFCTDCLARWKAAADKEDGWQDFDYDLEYDRKLEDI